MADYFQSSPNFVNPAYATPEQLATQRAYAAELTKRSGQPVNRPLGAVANLINALTGGIERNRAMDIQNQQAGQNASDMSAMIAQLQGGTKVDPQNLGRMIANPLVSPEQRALALKLMTPERIEDVAGRPAYASPVTGVQGAPMSGYEPGYRAQESAGPVSTVSPIAAPPLQKPIDAVSPNGGVFGGMNSRPVDWPNGQPPAQPAAAPAGVSPRLKQMAADAQQIEAEGARVKAGAGGEGEVILKDVTRAAAAPETLKGLGIMRNTIQSVGDKMTFGPTAKFSNEARRVISNYAPGLVDEKALAGADAIEKLNLGLAGNLSQQLGLNPSDIFRSVASVPGNEKSKEGTLALISMMEQQARNDQYVGTTLYQQNRGNLAGYQQARANYYSSHPIINPITGNPIEIDAKKAQETQGTQGGPVPVSSPEEARKLPRGTAIRLPDGSIGRVP